MSEDQSRVHFIDRGRRAPTEAVLAQAQASRDAARAHRERLAQHGFTPEAAAALEWHLQALAQMWRPEPADRAGRLLLPQSTAQLWECKGKLLALIDELNEAGRHAYAHDAAAAAAFNQDVLQQALESRQAAGRA